MPRTIIINILEDDINSVFAHLLNHIDAIIRHEKQRCHPDNLCICVSVSYHRTQCVRVYLYKAIRAGRRMSSDQRRESL